MTYSDNFKKELNLENKKLTFDEKVKGIEITADNGDIIKFLGFFFIIKIRANFSSTTTIFFVEINGDEAVVMYETCDVSEGWVQIIWDNDPYDYFWESKRICIRINKKEIHEYDERIYFEKASAKDKKNWELLEHLE